MSFGALFDSSVLFSVKSVVARGPSTLVSLCCCNRLPLDDFLALPIMILLGVVPLSVVALFFEAEDTSRSPGFMISTSCAKLQSLVFLSLLLRGVSLKAFSPRSSFLEGAVSTEVNYLSTLVKRRFSHISTFVSCFFDLPNVFYSKGPMALMIRDIMQSEIILFF